MYIDDRPTDQRPATDRPLISKISNGHISTTGHPIHFMFGSRVGFSGTPDLMALFPVRSNPRWRPPPSWNKFQMAISPQPVVRSTPCLVLGWVFGDGGSNGTISANHMYGQFTCLRRQHHITSLLMRKTFGARFCIGGFLGYTVSKQEIK